MVIEYSEVGGELRWVKNPFTGAVTYFTHVDKKRSGFVRHATAVDVPPPVDLDAEQARRRIEMDAATRACPFCPGNEAATSDEVLRVTEADLGIDGTGNRWLIRGVRNIIPRIPESCTGGRNESYVVIEDPRHYRDPAAHEDALLYSALLSRDQFHALLGADVEVARRAYSNPSVGAVLIRKNQGHESGASQPHVHNQVIGSGIPFPTVGREAEVTAAHPSVWADSIAFARDRGFLVAEREGCIAYFCPFGTFPRSYDIVFPEEKVRFVDLPKARRRIFVDLLFEVLQLLGPLPLDYEIHDGGGVPLHAHVNARHFAYSNIGGTLNLPTSLLGAGPSRR